MSLLPLLLALLLASHRASAVYEYYLLSDEYYEEQETDWLDYSGMFSYSAYKPGVADVSYLQSEIRSPGAHQVQATFGDTSDSYVVSWTTFTAGDYNDLYYGPAPQQLYRSVRAHESMYHETLCGSVRYIHSARVEVPRNASTNLLVREVYYRIGPPGSRVLSFTPVRSVEQVTPEEPLVISLTADYGTKYPMGSTKQLLSYSRGRKHDAVMLVGDIAYNMNDKCGVEGDRMFDILEPSTSTTPWAMVAGNHENDNAMTSQVFTERLVGQRYVAMGSNSSDVRWFSFDLPYVHVVALATEPYNTPQQWHLALLQWRWLNDDLAKVNRTKTPWVVVLGHRPMYCHYAANQKYAYTCNEFADAIKRGQGGSMGHNMQMPVWEPNGLETLFAHYGVDLYFSGHNHMYLRSWPVHGKPPPTWQPAHSLPNNLHQPEQYTKWDEFTPQWQESYSDPNATVYVVAGNTGVWDTDYIWEEPGGLPGWVSLYDNTTRNGSVYEQGSYACGQPGCPRNGWAQIRVSSGKALEFIMRDAQTGKVYDNFTITKSKPQTFGTTTPFKMQYVRASKNATTTTSSSPPSSPPPAKRPPPPAAAFKPPPSPGAKAKSQARNGTKRMRLRDL